ncbi:MAG: dUTP diphosphatase [Hyphomicrobiaceae bacterium]|nr:MAG: dUTP diphosphatase [Hyphomicrobiaceae bacterium]
MEETLEGHLCEFAQLLSGRCVRLEARPPKPSAPDNGPTLKVAKLSQDAYLPTRATAGSAGLDLYLPNGNLVVIGPGERRLVSTGLQVIVPEGYEGQVRPRSGRAFKDGLTVLNSPGTIDSDYRGELLVLLINLGEQSVTLMSKERIAQFVIAPVVKVRVEEISGHDGPTTRAGGFGSTGS